MLYQKISLTFHDYKVRALIVIVARLASFTVSLIESRKRKKPLPPFATDEQGWVF